MTGKDKTRQWDFSKYQTKGLTKNLTDLISVPAAIRSVFFAMILIVILIGGSVVWLLPLDEASTLVKNGVYAYSISLGFLLGIFFGILRVIGLAMRNVEELLTIILQITNQAATDYGEVQTGEFTLPSGAELTEMVYLQVVLPVIETVVKRVFGILGRPIFWVYRRSIGSAVRLVIQGVKRLPEAESETDVIQQTATASLGAVANRASRIHSFTNSASSVVASVGASLRFFTMLPLFGIFGLATLVGATPLFLVWYFVLK